VRIGIGVGTPQYHTGSQYSVLFVTAPGPTFEPAVAQNVTVATSDDRDVEFSFTSSFTAIVGSGTPAGGTLTTAITALVGDAGATYLYVRDVGGTTPVAALVCTVSSAGITIASPAPGTTIIVGISTAVTGTSDGFDGATLEASFTAAFTAIVGTSGVIPAGGAWSLNATALIGDNGAVFLYVREVGGTTARATLACTVVVLTITSPAPGTELIAGVEFAAGGECPPGSTVAVAYDAAFTDVLGAGVVVGDDWSAALTIDSAHQTATMLYARATVLGEHGDANVAVTVRWPRYEELAYDTGVIAIVFDERTITHGGTPDTISLWTPGYCAGGITPANEAAAQANAALQPDYTSADADYGNLPSSNATVAGDFLTVVGVADIAQPWARMLVARGKNAAGAYMIDGGASTRRGVIGSDAASGGVDVVSSGTQVSTTFADDITRPHMWTFVANGAASTVRRRSRNGTLLTQTSLSTNTHNSKGMSMHASYAGTSGRISAVKDVVVWSTPPSDADQVLIETYILGGKYGWELA